MSVKDNFKSKYRIWKKTSDLYVDWVASSKLRFFFSENINFESLSLWWATNICRKDNMLGNHWFIDLKQKLFENKKTKYNSFLFILIFFTKFFKNFFFDIIWYSALKFLSFTRFKDIKRRKNCFHSINYNFFRDKGFNYDRCFGDTHLKNSNKNFFLISTIRRKKFFSDLFKSKKIKNDIPFFVSDEHISFLDVVNVYFTSLKLFFKTKNYLNVEKNLFKINNKNCKDILEPLLLSSFSGNIQDQILIGLSIRNFFKKKKINYFFTYSEFNPGVRSVYYFIRDTYTPPKIVAIQHGHSNENLMFFKHKAKEFHKSSKYEGKIFSPAPDIYLTQGDQYTKILSKYFPRKIKKIGCLKYDLINFNKKNKNKKLIRIKKLKKKIILLCPSIGDDDYLLNYLNKIVNEKYIYILSPHPAYRRIITRKYLSELKKKCDIRVFKEFTTNDLLGISDFIICGFSTVAYEALFSGVNPIRAIEPNSPQYFDANDRIPLAENYQDLSFLIQNFKLKNRLFLSNFIKKEYFYRLDRKSKIRFWKALK